MSFPSDLRIIDTYMSFYPFRPQKDMPLRASRHADEATKESSVGFMFKDSILRPDQRGKCGADLLVPEMDRHNIERAVVTIILEDQATLDALKTHPERFIPVVKVDPNDGMDAVRLLERMVKEYGIKAASLTPAFLNPPVPINDKKVYPVYAKCVELGLPVFITVGIPGPRIPYEAQYVGLLDEVCWFFPELTVIMRHGGEPWTDLAVKLMLKWPNLYYSTSAFAPKHYPDDIVRYLNSRGRDKVMYAGYFPTALSLDRIFDELPQLKLKQEAWPKFLRENALRALKLV